MMPALVPTRCLHAARHVPAAFSAMCLLSRHCALRCGGDRDARRALRHVRREDCNVALRDAPTAAETVDASTRASLWVLRARPA
ncbi:hypothetical protein KM539_15080 [Xanthomonas translucens pv. poae]|uniref:hypothetical protein n=1 Tax=Xanthomonas graminis TaxID=3390026 RepID=UPI001F370B42|nr:hypothetical protein [Xanthomonas translucens]UKE61090.1 hypothetical protein KM539_15080 [Xanthomonas translucens pv. poae]